MFLSSDCLVKVNGENIENCDGFFSKESVCDGKLTVIVPTYNEKENIAELISRIEDNLSSTDFEVLVVDDNSPDGTSIEVEKLNEQYGNLKVLKRNRKSGLSSAVTEGFGYARLHSKFFAVIDADLQHPPELLNYMYRKIANGHDLVIASRYSEGGSVSTFSVLRKFLSKGATVLAHILLLRTRPVDDILSGFFMMNRDVLVGTDLEPIGYKILLEIVVKGNYEKIHEVPYKFGSRKKGDSNLSLREIKNYLIQLAKLAKFCYF